MFNGAREIKRFYFVIHPFFHWVHSGTANREIAAAEAEEIEAEWHETIQRVVQDKESVLVIHPNVNIFAESTFRAAAISKNLGGLTKIMDLVQFAKEMLGQRLLVSSRGKFVDAQGRRFATPKAALLQNGFVFYPNRIKTKGMGEYTLQCVFQETARLNFELEMPNPIPWKNRQSTILPKKSISEKLGEVLKAHYPTPVYYPTPAERRQLIENIKQRKRNKIERMRQVMQKYRDTKFEAMGVAKKMLKEGRYRRK